MDRLITKNPSVAGDLEYDDLDVVKLSKLVCHEKDYLDVRAGGVLFSASPYDILRVGIDENLFGGGLENVFTGPK